jgi:hypothetical protein
VSKKRWNGLQATIFSVEEPWEAIRHDADRPTPIIATQVVPKPSVARWIIVNISFILVSLGN